MQHKNIKLYVYKIYHANEVLTATYCSKIHMFYNNIFHFSKFHCRHDLIHFLCSQDIVHLCIFGILYFILQSKKIILCFKANGLTNFYVLCLSINCIANCMCPCIVYVIVLGSTPCIR